MADQDNPSVPEQPEKTPPVRKRRRGWWWKIPLILLVLLVLLILLLPTIASTGPVRNMILGQVNANLPGKLSVADWSLGWFSGTQARGVEWRDADGRRVANVSEVNTPITLGQLVRGNMHLGEIVVRGVQADLVVPVSTQAEETPTTRPTEPRREPQAPSQQPSPAGPIEIPDVSAKVRVEDVSGQITFLGEDGEKAVVNLDKSTRLLADLPGGGATSTVDALVAIAQPIGVSETKLNLKVDGIRPGPLDLKTITANGTLQLTKLDLQGVAEIIRATGQELAVQGVLGGQVDFSSPGPGQMTAKGEFAATDVVTKFTADQFQTKALRIPVDAEITGGEGAAAIVRQLGIFVDQGQVNVTAEVPLKTIDDLQNDRPITQPGSVKISAQVPQLPVLMNALRNSVKLQEGVKVTGGSFDAQVNVDLAPSGISVRVPAYLRDLAAMRDGKQIGPLQPVSLEAAARLPSLNTAAADISDILVQVRSSFMTLDVNGDTLATTNAQGQADLAKLRDDFGTIIDLSAIRGGKATLNVVNRAGSGSSLDSDIGVQVTEFGYDMAAAEGTPARRVENGSLSLTGRSQYRDGKLTFVQPLRLQAGARVLELQAGNKWAGLLDESFDMVVSGSADLEAKPATAQIAQLDVTAGRSTPLLKLSKPDERPLEVVLDGKRGVTTDARLHVWADLAALQSLANRLSKPTSDAAVQKGTFDGDLVFAIAANGDLKVQLAKGQSDFVYGSPAATQPFSDRLTADVSLAVPGDDSKADVSANINSKLAKVILEATAGLNLAADGAAKLRNVRVSKLDAGTEYANVTLSKPLVISDVPAVLRLTSGGSLPQNAEVAGELVITADLAKAMAASTTQPEGAEFAGQVTSRQALSLKGRDLYADIDTQVTDLRITQEGRTVVQEPKLTASGVVRLSPDQRALQLNKVTVTSTSGMVDLKALMRVEDVGKTNNFKDARFEVTPDWSKLWPVIYAMLPAEKQQKIGEMVVTGNKPIVITVAGSLPMNEPYDAAVRKVIAAGSIPLENLDWKTRGITATGVVPFRLEGGNVHFIQGTLAQPRKAKPLAVNNGTVDISAAQIDVTGEIPRLNMPENTPLAKSVQLNSVLVASFGEYANPLFVNPEQASGTVDLTVAYCRKLPLTTAIYDPRAGGEAQVIVNLHELDLASKGVDYFMNALSVQPDKGKDRVLGEIKNGVVTIANGQVQHKMDLQLGDRAFSFDGTMRMEDMSYSALDAGVPRSVVTVMLDKWFGVEGAEQYLPQQVSLRFSGPASALKLDSGTVNRLVGDVAKQRGAAALGGLLGGSKQPSTQPEKPRSDADRLIDLLQGKEDKATTQPSDRPTEQPREKPLGGLLDMLGGQREEKK